MLTVDVITTRDGLLALRPAWLQLWEESGATVFSDFDWLFHWWQSLGRSERPLVLRVREGAKTVGIAPFMLSGKNGSRLSFLGAAMCDYCDILVPGGSREVLQALLEKLVDLEDVWRRAKLERMLETSTAWRLCALAAERGLSHVQSFGDERFAYVATPEDLATMEPGEHKHAGKRRSASHFRKHTELTRLSDPADIRAHLPMLFSMHAHRWRGTETPSMFHKADGRDFYYRLVDALAPRGLLSLVVLSYLGEPVGYSLDLHQDVTCYGYTIAYSPYFAASSPGLLLVNRRKTELLGLGFTRLDYLRGSHGFKQSLANTSYRTRDFELFRNPLLQGAVRTDAALRASAPGRWLRAKPSMRAARRLIVTREGRPADGFDTGRPALYDLVIPDRTVPPAGDTLAAPGTTGAIRVSSATFEDLPALGGLYGHVKDSPEAKRMEQWLARGATCLLARSGIAPLAAAWIFSGSTAGQAGVCPLTRPVKEGAERTSPAVLCHLMVSPAAADTAALPALMDAFANSTLQTGGSALLRVPRGMAESLPAPRAVPVAGRTCDQSCLTPPADVSSA